MQNPTPIPPTEWIHQCAARLHERWHTVAQAQLEDVLHKAIILSSKKVAGWAKPANLLKFILLGSACATAMGHALGADRRARIVSATGRQLVECATVCDSEVDGEETSSCN